MNGHWLYTVKVRAEAVAAMARVTTAERTCMFVWLAMRDWQGRATVSAGLHRQHFAGFYTFLGTWG